MKTKKLLYLMFGILFSLSTWAQSPTQQWLTVLNSTTTSVDQLYGFSTPSGGCTNNANYFANTSNHILINPSGSQIGFSATSNCNPFMGTLNTSTGAVLYQNTNAVSGYQSVDSAFDTNDNLFSLSTNSGAAPVSSYLRKTTNTGTISFTNTLLATSTQYDIKSFGIVKTDPTNRIYTYGMTHSSTSPFISNAVYCYDNLGVLQWSSATTDLDWFYGYPGRMTTDNNNNVIFSGKRQTTQGDQNTYDIVLRKVNSSGVQQWQVYYNYNNLADYIDSIVTDNNGDVYMISTNTNAWSTRTRRLVKLSGATGTIIFQQQISNTATSGDIKINSNGSIVVADDNVIKSFSPTNGSLLWTSPSLTNYQTFTTDSNGNIYVTLKDKVQIYNSAGTLINTITPTIASYTVNLRMSQLDTSGNSLYIIGERSNATTNKVFITKYSLFSYSDTCNAVSGSLVNGLKAYYPFCGNSNDQSGNSYNGIVTGATLTTDRFGNANSAYYFNGTSNITCAYSVLNKLIDSNNSFTINLWFNRDASGNNSSQQSERLLFAFDGANTSPFKRVSARINQISSSSSTITVNRYNASTMGAIGDVGARGLANNSDFLVPNTWYNFTYVYDGTQFYLYKNGQLMSITQTPAELPYYGASMGSGDNFVQSFVIGGNNQQNLTPFYGKLDDVGIWNRALTASEVTQLYNQNQCFTNTTVTDTLVINVGQMGFNPVTYANNITIYPNPASTQVNISFNTIADLNGGTIKIINSLGQQVATTPITTSGTNTSMTLSSWGGSGLYFVQIINPQGQIVDIKKILLQ